MSFDDVALVYDETRILPNWILNEFYQRTLKEEFRSNPDLFVLDAGIGTGRTVEPLLDSGIQLVGIDISKKMLEKMAERVKTKPGRNRVSLVLGDVTRLPFRACSFDMVMSTHVLHLLKKWKQAILEAKRVLKPRGTFVAASHNAPELENEIGRRYLEIFLGTFRKHGFLESMPFAKRVFATSKMKFLNRVFKRIRKYNSWESYLERKASSTEMYTIVWKETLSISMIADRLNKRFSYMKKDLSTEAFEKMESELTNWSTGKMKKNPFLEVRREFKLTMVQFKKHLL